MRLSLLCILFPALLFSQSTRIDSLLKVVQSSGEDTVKAIALGKLSRAWMDKSDYKKGLQYSLQAKELCEKLKFKKGLAAAHSAAGLSYYHLSDYYNAFIILEGALELNKELRKKN